MSVDVATLALQVRMTGAEQAIRDLRELQSQGGKAERAASGLKSAFSAVGAALATLGVGAAARQFVSAADSMTNLNSRLKIVTGSTQELATAKKELYAIAQRTNQSIDATATTYTRMSAAAAELKVSQADMLRVTEGINNGFRASGASSEEAKAAMIQLSQGFASGTLRGDELNSVLEQAPALSRAIAKEFGVTVGQLKKLGEAGQLTSESVFNALYNQAEALNAMGSQMDDTAGGAYQRLENAAAKAAEALNGQYQITEKIASFLSAVTTLMDDYTDATSAAAGQTERLTGIDLARWGWDTVEGIAPIVDFLDGIYRGIKQITISAGVVGRDIEWANKAVALVNPANVTDAKKNLTELAKLTDERSKKLDEANKASESLWSAPLFSDKIKGGREKWERAQVQKPYNDATQAMLGVVNGRGDRREVKLAPGKPKKGHKAPRTVEDEFNDLMARLRGDTIEAGYGDDRKNYAKTLSELETNKRYAGGSRDQKANALIAADRLDAIEREKKWREEAEKSTKAQNEAAAAQRDYIAAIGEENQAHLDKINFATQALTISKDEREQLELKTQLQERVAQREKEIRQAQSKGEISSQQANELSEALKAQASAWEQAALAALKYQQAVSKDGMTGVTQGLQEYTDSVADMASQTRNLVTDAFQGMEDALTKFVTTGKMDVKSLANSIIADLARIAIRQSITGPLAQGLMGMLGGGVGGGVGMGSQFSSSGAFSLVGFQGLAGARASGGPVSAGKTYLVGEKGPELFTPPTSGGIVPNHALGSAPNVSVNVIDQSTRQAPAAATAGQPRLDGDKWVIDVVMRDFARGGKTRDLIKQGG